MPGERADVGEDRGRVAFLRLVDRQPGIAQSHGGGSSTASTPTSGSPSRRKIDGLCLLEELVRSRTAPVSPSDSVVVRGHVIRMPLSPGRSRQGNTADGRSPHLVERLDLPGVDEAVASWASTRARAVPSCRDR